MSVAEYQRSSQVILQRTFADVRLEWSVVKDATDALAVDRRRYAPRVDIAVGPFNTTPGGDPRINDGELPETVLLRFRDRAANPNPRCLLAIEVCFSGSSKHILGDILNAGALGLYGMVVGRDDNIAKIRRNFEYLKALAQLEKLPWLFQNVLALSTAEFDALFAEQ